MVEYWTSLDWKEGKSVSEISWLDIGHLWIGKKGNVGACHQYLKFHGWILDISGLDAKEGKCRSVSSVSEISLLNIGHLWMQKKGNVGACHQYRKFHG